MSEFSAAPIPRRRPLEAFPRPLVIIRRHRYVRSKPRRVEEGLPSVFKTEMETISGTSERNSQVGFLSDVIFFLRRDFAWDPDTPPPGEVTGRSRT